MNLKTKKITKKYAGSTKVEKPKFYKNKGRGMMESPVYQMSNSWYGDIYYDQYRKLYYRSASIGREIPDSELNPMANLKLYKSLNNDDIYALTIILDENFKKVGEVYGIRLTKRSFATESNLLIEDSKYDSENEDIIVFKRYNINNIDNEIR